VTRTILYTALALTAFAFNSILCRLALRGGEADAAGFTLVRLVSGAAMMLTISMIVHRRAKIDLRGGSWASAFFLFAYAICFSFAYLGLTAGTGALILFGSVQLTMIAVSIIRGEKPAPLEWLGLAIAIAGLVYLVAPSLQSPPLASSLMMAAAGAAWGFYTIRGKGSGDPIANTAGNFVRSIPMIVLIAVFMSSKVHLSGRGVTLAVLSGAAASGIGYSIWYAALKYHTTVRAAVLQLPVPLLTAVLGVFLLAEAATARLLVASGLILGGIGLTIFRRRRS
jgi:drug/metabolite transporter (DMT)-like permease